MRLLVTRSREDAAPLAERLRRLGAEPVLEPLLFIDDVDGPALDLDGVQALLVTSANGVRAFARRDDGRSLAVYAVGDASARAARDAGFIHVESASGDVDALALVVAQKLDPGAGSLLHVAGSKVAGDLKGMLEKHGFDYRRQVLYEARKADRLSSETTQALGNGEVDGVLFFSPRTAAVFAALAAGAGLGDACREVTALCLSPAVAARIEDIDWRDIWVADRPEQASLLETVAREVKKSRELKKRS